MTERIPKGVMLGVALLAPVTLAFLAYTRPGYFTNELYIGALLMLEILIAAVWMYRTVYFPIVVSVFLLAGMGAPGQWTAARWLVLGIGAWVGLLVTFKERSFPFGLFHAAAACAALAAFISAAVSRYPGVAMLKALSVLLLFMYAATGVRVAVRGRENRFFPGLITGCEVFVGLIVVLYALHLEVMGNPNSLGGVMGVVGVPTLLWGVFQSEKRSVRWRRLVLLSICVYLVFHSEARAGIAAALVSAGILCLGLRRYKLLIQGAGALVILIAAVATLQPEVFSNTVSSATSSVMYKGKDPNLGIFASRESPWQSAMDSIRSHFWFGTGFGTTDKGEDASESVSQFSTQTGVSAENGSSFLAILTWVGIAGIVPFFFLLVALILKIVHTLAWMFRSGMSSHPAIPIALVLIAGLVHASFEDWLFAPGYYLCVFFWSLAFILVDVAPSTPALQFASSWRMARGPDRFSIVPGR